MGVAVSEGGEYCPSVEIHDLGAGNCGTNLLTGPNMGDSVALDRDSLVQLGIEGTNPAVGEDSLWRDHDQVSNIGSYTWTFESGPDL